MKKGCKLQISVTWNQSLDKNIKEGVLLKEGSQEIERLETVKTEVLKDIANI